MIISMVAAMSENRAIGRGGKLPWNIPADLARFKALTTGHVVVMGRKTYESIGHPLPGRTNIVLSREKTAITGCLVAASFQEAFELAAGEEEIFVIGGGELFREALPLAHRVYLTIVHCDYQGDTFFPEVPNSFLETGREEITDPPLHFSFVTLERVEQVGRDSDARELCRKGQVALNRELYYLARSCFEKASELESSPEISALLAFSLVKTGTEPEVGLALAQKALEREPNNPAIYLNLGRIQALAGQRDAALDSFRLGIQVGGGEEFLEELATHGPRQTPPIGALPRSNPVNKYLGMLLRRFGKK